MFERDPLRTGKGRGQGFGTEVGSDRRPKAGSRRGPTWGRGELVDATSRSGVDSRGEGAETTPGIAQAPKS